MALKSTIYKISLQLADMDRNYYADHALTIARHPSETDERMMMRVLAFALHADDALALGKGLSDDDEPDLWRRDLTGAIEQWIEVGLPDDRRLIRAAGRAGEVVVLAYGSTVPVWWKNIAGKLERVKKLKVFQVSADTGAQLAALVERTMQLTITIQEGHIMVSNGSQVVEFEVHTLRGNA